MSAFLIAGAQISGARARPALTPAGAQGLCQNYSWACSGSSRGSVTAPDDMLHLADAVNQEVNHEIRPVSDERQYGRAEFWHLPDSGAGDCEDYALLKKKRLIEKGIAPDRMRLAQVIKRGVVAHVVLLLDIGGQDYVLDNLTNSMRLRQSTQYVVLKTQSPREPAQWVTDF